MWGDESEHHTMVWADAERYIGYLFWTGDGDGGESAGDSGLVLRQMFVERESRRQGLSEHWLESGRQPHRCSFVRHIPEVMK
jgi:hypothetical protein